MSTELSRRSRRDVRSIEEFERALDILILRTLQWGPQHGHGSGQAIRSQADDLLTVETGSRYPTLHGLEKRGWLKSVWDVSKANQRTKYYRLTAPGKAQRSREHDRRYFAQNPKISTTQKPKSSPRLRA